MTNHIQIHLKVLSQIYRIETLTAALLVPLLLQVSNSVHKAIKIQSFKSIMNCQLLSKMIVYKVF